MIADAVEREYKDLVRYVGPGFHYDTNPHSYVMLTNWSVHDGNLLMNFWRQTQYPARGVEPIPLDDPRWDALGPVPTPEGYAWALEVVEEMLDSSVLDFVPAGEVARLSDRMERNPAAVLLRMANAEWIARQYR